MWRIPRGSDSQRLLISNVVKARRRVTFGSLWYLQGYSSVICARVYRSPTSSFMYTQDFSDDVPKTLRIETRCFCNILPSLLKFVLRKCRIVFLSYFRLSDKYSCIIIYRKHAKVSICHAQSSARGLISKIKICLDVVQPLNASEQLLLIQLMQIFWQMKERTDEMSSTRNIALNFCLRGISSEHAI